MTDDLIKRRFADLANQADKRTIYTFTDFLTEAEISDFYAVLPSLPNVGYAVWGGFDGAERKMLRFGSPDFLGYEQDFPIVCLAVSPLQAKFADTLTHRDFLGALMHLGIERQEIGDILVQEKSAYVFCTEKMADYICRELQTVRHTSVKCTAAETVPDAVINHTEPVDIQAASERADGIIAKLYRISRSECSVLFTAERVFVNGRAVNNSAAVLKSGDTVSVRGFGKFRYAGVQGTTRKGNLVLHIEKFA